ncbi:hypothetical protein TrispH2_002265 [Trichoplax sp. H2]|nr:hypothetical protein TrispH2_002265 [Trichoplax sp. H2]|eukprot:RDD45348.1 hypothetical protein TrispH2_002265 [Trichoplax sp. H2]
MNKMAFSGRSKTTFIQVQPGLSCDDETDDDNEYYYKVKRSILKKSTIRKQICSSEIQQAFFIAITCCLAIFLITCKVKLGVFPNEINNSSNIHS